MSRSGFHAKPFDEGTLTKLQILSLYTREWLPVFLSAENPRYAEIHIFDFFAGPGIDSTSELGSPLRLLRQLRDYRGLASWKNVMIHVHFFDKSRSKILELEQNIALHGLRLPDVWFDLRPLGFEAAFPASLEILSRKHAAKLVFIDQFGVDQVRPDVFQTLVNSPTCDFLFFLSSSTLHRFRDHPVIKMKIERPEDYFHVHRAALEYYRELIPAGIRYFLAPFSIKKGANIYGLIFGSAHPLGIDKFLRVAWQEDQIGGEANFDIFRENIRSGELLLPFKEFQPTKIAVFEAELEQLIRSGHIENESEVLQSCFAHGVKRQHAKPVLQMLKRTGVIESSFIVSDIGRIENPRPIRLVEE